MGRYERGVHFGAASLKRGEESSKFPVAVFCPTFSYTIFKQFFNILAVQNKNYFKEAISDKSYKFLKKFYSQAHRPKC